MKSAPLQYANALADVVLQQGAAEPISGQLAEFAGLLSQSAELRSFLSSPAIARQAKHAVIEKIVARAGASRILRNFLYVLVDQHRTFHIPEIAAAFRDVVRERQGIVEAEITSAVELSAAQRADLGKVLERLAGKKLETRYALDPALLGGAIVRVGSTVYDGSVRNRLERLHTRLASE